MMRKIALVLGLMVIAGGTPALAENSSSTSVEPWSVGALIERAGIDRVWVDRAVEVVPASVRSIDTAELSSRLAEYIPAQVKNLPGMGHTKQDEEMRAMVIAMGAMSGYMVAAMPLSLSGVVWAAAGGFAAHYWYENFR